MIDVISLWEGLRHKGIIKVAVFKDDQLMRIQFVSEKFLKEKGLKLIRGKKRTAYLRRHNYVMDKSTRKIRSPKRRIR